MLRRMQTTITTREGNATVQAAMAKYAQMANWTLLEESMWGALTLRKSLQLMDSIIDFGEDLPKEDLKRAQTHAKQVWEYIWPLTNEVHRTDFCGVGPGFGFGFVPDGDASLWFASPRQKEERWQVGHCQFAGYASR